MSIKESKWRQITKSKLLVVSVAFIVGSVKVVGNWLSTLVS
jgi:hypothetical protein